MRLRRWLPVLLLTVPLVAASGPFGMTGRVPFAGSAMPPVVTGPLPERLSQTGLFSDVATLTPVPGLVPYDMISPLWSDGADKRRWVALPTGTTIGFSPTGEYRWPQGTLFIKHFEREVDAATHRVQRLETRVLVLDAAGPGTYGVTYRWRPDGQDADLVPADGAEEVLALRDALGAAGTQTWSYPSRENCLTCHTPAAGYVLGPKTAQLNGTFTYPDGTTAHQLRTWNHLGLFDRKVEDADLASAPTMAAIDDPQADLTRRVRSYLDANCASCHRPEGVGSDLDLRFTTPLEATGLIGGLVRNDMGIDGAGPIVPGDVARSVVHYRMRSTVPEERMPQIGRALVDQPAVDAVAAWIAQLPKAP